MSSWRITVVLCGVVAAATAHAEGNSDRAKDDYQLHCMGCHGENGRGLKGKVPSFPDDLARLLTTRRGREFIQRVPGVSFSNLPSARLAAVLNWIVQEWTEPTFASEFKPFSADEIDKMRQAPLLEVATERSAL